jgi:hypothetical protein
MTARLESRGRRVVNVRPPDHPRAGGDARAAAAFLAEVAAGCTVVWLALPPVPLQADLASAALTGSWHLLVDKPWVQPVAASRALDDLARSRGLVATVHVQFVMLAAARALSASTDGGAGLTFAGRFRVPAPRHGAIPPALNLGLHLRALHALRFPRARLGALDAAYASPAARAFTLARPDGTMVHRVDFQDTTEPLVDRVRERVEAAIAGQGRDPALCDLETAARLARDAGG